MSSLRQKQIDEVLQYDKVINSRVFGREIDQVAQFNDPKSRPNKDDITFQAEVEKRIQEIMTIIQKLMNSVGSDDFTFNLSGAPGTGDAGDADGGDDEGEEGAGKHIFRKKRKVGGVTSKDIKGLVESTSLKEKINNTENLTADILNRYNSLIDYILQYKRYTIYGNQSVQDAQFTADKIKTLLQPLKGLLMKIQSSDDDQLFTKTYNVLNKIIQVIEDAPPYQKVDFDELNKEVLPQDVSQLRKYGISLGSKLAHLDEKIKKAESYIPVSQRDRDGKAELVAQLQREKAKLKENWDELERPEIQHAIDLYDQLEDETLDPDDREEIKRSIELYMRTTKSGEFNPESYDALKSRLEDLEAEGSIDEETKEKILEQARAKIKTKEQPIILTDVSSQREQEREKRNKQLESRYQARSQNIQNRIRAYREAIDKALALRKREDKLNRDIATRNASIKPTTATRRRNQIRAMNATDQAEIGRIQADRDYMDDADIQDIRNLIEDEMRDADELLAEYNKAIGSGKKKGGRKFTPQYAPDLEDYDENELGDTNKTDNLQNLQDEYIVNEDDIQVGRGKKGKKVCMPKNDYMNEHHHLINLLNSASGNLKKEARKQKKEIEGSGLASDLFKMVSKVKTKLKDDKEKGVGAFDPEFKENYKKNPTSLTDALANTMSGKKGGASSNIQKGMYPRGKLGPSNEDNDKAHNMAMSIDKIARRKVQLGKEDVKALKPVLPLGGIPEIGASGAGRVTKGEDFGMLLAKLKDGKKSRKLKKAKKSSKYTGGALSFNDDNNEMFD